MTEIDDDSANRSVVDLSAHRAARPVVVELPDEPPVLTPPVAAALFTLLADAHRRANEERSA